MVVTTNQVSFRERNAPAEKKEMVVRKAFEDAKCYVRNDNQDSRQDFNTVVNQRFEKVEVKDEDNYAHSGNIAIETFQHDRETQTKIPSGLMTTEASLCIHTLREKAAIYRVRPMLYFLKNTPHIFPEQSFKDSDHGNGGHVIPIKELEQFEWFDICSIQDLPRSKVISYTFGAKQAGKMNVQMTDFIANKGWKSIGQLELV